jgi:hypothetical protein
LQAHGPRTLLAIGPQASALAADYRDTHPECTVDCVDPHATFDADTLLAELSRRPRFDFAIVRGVLERLDTESGANLIARIRDLHSRRFCVVLGVDEGAGGVGGAWKAADLIAFGLSHWSTGALGDATVRIYGYDVGSYKATPDWLNPRHWAHPEHWNKFRW